VSFHTDFQFLSAASKGDIKVTTKEKTFDNNSHTSLDNIFIRDLNHLGIWNLRLSISLAPQKDSVKISSKDDGNTTTH
jgi:hypothetical protein